ncbi:hypothetical protein PRIPAC_87857 [Pristionchus pacificus]|uniref:Uncharacterized protein n=1 Tax=Pristionchus pacificus TaxID=54126 RepID=A0A2A6CY34_PRIPA|nr:hypothetical protein PRIPAC_87857 [Pristionchus pacificus]|eukprot:PDM83085.1 hypothetical protein PRIPAC_37478 [Pristionchus pacificus]
MCKGMGTIASHIPRFSHFSRCCALAESLRAEMVREMNWASEIFSFRRITTLLFSEPECFIVICATPATIE